MGGGEGPIKHHLGEKENSEQKELDVRIPHVTIANAVFLVTIIRFDLEGSSVLGSW
jgi:hypothetical protein